MCIRDSDGLLVLVAGVVEAIVATRLEEDVSRLPGDHADQPCLLYTSGRHAVGTADAPFVELPRRAGAPRLTLLSPSPQSLAALFKVWDRELARLAASDEPAPLEAIASRGRSTLDLEALSARKTAVDRAPANGSSIAVLLEHKGVSVLLGADAYPTVLVPALKALAAHRGETLPLRVDVFKLSHHGSRANVTIDLLKAVQAQHYICLLYTSRCV